MTPIIQLTTAMEMFEDDSLNLSMFERLNLLRQAFFIYKSNYLKKLAQGGNDISKSEKELVKEGEKVLKSLEQLHNAQMKANKVAGKRLDASDDDWIKKLNERADHLGSIVRDMKEKIA